MKVTKYENEQDWLEARRGLITGTKAGGLFSKRDGTPLKGYYEVIAEQVAVPHNGENVMDRGKRLEDEALDRFALETGKKLDTSLYICTRDDESRIGYSPDALVVKKGKKHEDVEVKCLNSAAHLEAFLTQQVPSEYQAQIIQGFVTDDLLDTRYLVFYDPRMPCDFFFLTITRKELQADIQVFLNLERRALEQIRAIEKQLTF